MSNVGISDHTAFVVPVVHRATVYSIGGVNILIVISCDHQVVTPTTKAIIVQTVVPKDVARRICYEYAVVLDCVVDYTVCDIDMSGCRRKVDTIVVIVPDGAAGDCYVVLSSDA